MALIYGSCTGTSGSKYNIWLDYTVGTYSIPNNNTPVNIKLYLQRNDGFAASAFNLSATNYRYTRYDGGNESGYEAAIDTRNSALVLLKETNYTIAHNEDGTKTVNLSGYFQIDGLTSLVDGTVSGNVVLPTIPRGILNTKVSGVWKQGLTYVNVSGVWKQAVGVYTKVSGIWKQSV